MIPLNVTRGARHRCSMTEQLYLVTERELNQIKNDCAYPESESCVGCPLADGEDDTRASGMGCNFKGANALMDEVLSRPAQQAQPTRYDQHWKDLFLGDVISSIRWEANRGNPSLFRAIEILKAHQSKDVQQPQPDVLAELEKWHRDKIEKLHKPVNGAVSIVAIRSAKIQHEKSITEIARLRGERK